MFPDLVLARQIGAKTVIHNACRAASPAMSWLGWRRAVVLFMFWRTTRGSRAPGLRRTVMATVMAKKPKQRDDFRAAEAASLFAGAVRLHQAGRLREAEPQYRQVLAADPEHVDALHLLGVLAHQAGRPDGAIELIGKALALNGRVPEFHYNIGLAYGALGRFTEAATHNARAVALRPDYAEAHLNLGNALHAQRDYAGALESYRRALALRPGSPELHFNIANALAAAGRAGEAVTQYQQALALRADYAEAHNNLGAAQVTLGALAEAAASFRRALQLKPDLPGTALGLARVLLALGDIENALKVARALHRAGETAETRALFFLCLRDPRATPFAAAHRAEVIRAIREPWGNPRVLSGLAAALLRADPATGPIVARAETGEIAAGDLAILARDDLLGATLESVQVSDAGLERLLTQARRLLLDTADDRHDALAFSCALARQCFINEYVFACSDAETAQARTLHDSIAAALQSGGAISAYSIASLAAYTPLHALPGADALRAREWPEALQALLTQQVSEPAEEARLRAAMPRLTGISDGVSQAVRAQYEENPYPRWTRTAATGQPRTVDEYLAERFPKSAFRPLGKASLDYLIAGCGTGQQAAGVTLLFRGLSVTAIDLSLASLAYAKRKTAELGLHDIAYGQADILELGRLGRTFDVVDSAGVLHHMADPFAGWRVLIGLLNPDGLMRIALYSTIARRDIAAARRWIAERGWPATPEGIRAARQAILALPDGAPERNVMLIDFFSLSDCRDLLFHVQEHTFEIPAIAGFLAENGLAFLGFEVAPHVAQQYAERFPGDAAQTNLDNWNTFEHDNPDTFIATYEFWAQKRAPAQ
jgi:tetratricopeptide (TPR) repeat protein/SAM-dependent methyltransferase